jgi:hypothetical protein
MPIDFKPNFFTGDGTKPAPVPTTQLLQIALVNDPKFRERFGMWLYDSYSELMEEYKTYGRFLSLKEIESSPSKF